jgi:imidazolonepropionase-like amidohydrolase
MATTTGRHLPCVRAAHVTCPRGIVRPMKLTSLLLLLLVCAHADAANTAPAPVPRIAVRAAHMIDVAAGKRIDDVVVLIEGDHITQAGHGLAIPAGVRVIDLGAATLLPGLIDVHTHLSGQSGDYYTDLFRRSPVDNAVRAPTYAFHTLQAGFTTVRDVGAGEYIDVSLRDAINDGSIPGPRMRVATLPISATGGHGDLNGFSPRVKIEGPGNIPDGVPDFRK